MPPILPYTLTCLLAFAGLGQAADCIWVEGEAPESQSMHRHPWWYDKVKTHLLSNDDFISNWSDKPGEATLDYGRGLCLLSAPKAQGVTGFLKTVGTFTLDDVTIRSGNDYAAVLVVSMDGKPLKTSGKVLVQVGTTERPTGWATRPVKLDGRTGEEVVNFGKAPWLIARATSS